MKLGASSLSLGQLTGADGLAHLAGDSWWPAHLSLAECSGPDQCGWGRAVTRPCRRLMWDDGAVFSQDEPGLGQGQGSWFSMEETAKGAVGRLWTVLGEKAQEDKWHHFGQSLATDRPRSYRFLSL